ncbi:MAG: right-handed parallel beta-helix repeat-containing protein [Lentisphaerae bacterium]|nr:right-handed parallel beta-helix repeat-containing protein [Lentisphaerota bacterium]
MIVVAVLALCLGSQSRTYADAPPSLTVERVHGLPPKIDGVLDDDAWQTAAIADRFVRVDGTAASGDACLRVTYDETNVYAATECFATPRQLQELKSTATWHDSDDIWDDDEVELFLDPAGGGDSYYQLIVNARGVTWDAYAPRVRASDKSWEPLYTVKTHVGAESWTVEVAIPWSSFSRTAQLTNTWRFECVVGRSAGEPLYWAPTFGRDTHVPARFGFLRGLPSMAPQSAPRVARKAMNIHVSPHGDDRCTGETDEVNATCGPVATLERARALIRAARQKAGLQVAATVFLHGGKYFLPETLVLGEKDAGAPGNPITWCAAPGEQPVLSGGRPVSGWRPHTNQILQANLPGPRTLQPKFRQLYCDGRRMIRARWPNYEPENPLYGGWALPAGADEDQPYQAFTVRNGFFRQPWAHPEDAEVNMMIGLGWLNQVMPVASVDPSRRLIVLQQPVKDFDRLPWYWPVPITKDCRFYVENVLEELDQPGEWCADYEAGRLYFWPTSDVAKAQVVVPRLATLIDLRQTSWVNLRGLTFTETMDGDNYHRPGLDVGAMFNIDGLAYGGEAVHLRNALHCRVEYCTFRAVGGNGIYLELENARNVIARNEFDACGANSIVLAGDRFHHPMFNRVEHNAIHDGGVLNKYTAGVFLGISDGNFVRHNRIERMPHHAVNLAENPHGRNVVEYNWIQHADQEISDSAAINCWMEKPVDPDAERTGHIIRFNFIADTHGCETKDGRIGPTRDSPAFGIYLDNETSQCFVYGNVIVRAGSAGILVHMGKNNLIENNIIVECPVGIRFQEPVARSLEYYRRFLGFMTGNAVSRNILSLGEHQPVFLYLDGWTDRVLAECDGNILFTPRGGAQPQVALEPAKPSESRMLSIAEWRDMGYDEHSVVADPGFVDAPHDDYRLLPDSPALALGFQPIPFDQIGIRTEADRQ